MAKKIGFAVQLDNQVKVYDENNSTCFLKQVLLLGFLQVEFLL